MSGCRRFCQSGINILAGLLLLLSVARAEVAPWEAWIPASAAGHDVDALRQKFSLLSKEQRVAAGLHLIQKWGREARKEVFEVLESSEISVEECFAHWTRRDFEAALERAEQWDGFGGNYLRQAVFRAVAKSDPVEAARRMRARLDPMSRTYYYYVMLQGLVPELANQPARVILQALHEIRSDLCFMDEFRWGDAVYELAGTRYPWKPANPSRDWEYLISQPPSVARDLVLSLTLQVWLQRDLEKAIALDVPPLYEDLVKYRLDNAFPDDVQRVPELLPVANTELMRSWIRHAERKHVECEWRQWASLSAYLPKPSARERALDTVMRLWLERDEVAARAWMQDLPSGPAREVAEAACLEAEIGHVVKEDWHRALSLAKAMPEGTRRQRCLKTVFADAASEKLDFVQKELDVLALPKPQQAQMRDAWRLSRRDYLQRLKVEDGHDPLGAYALMLDLEDAGMRRIYALEHLGPLQSSKRNEDLQALIEKSSLSREEKDACLLQRIYLAVDGSPNGLDTAGRLKLSMDITDDETRFVHQRAVIQEMAYEHPEKAEVLVESSVLKEEDKHHLRKELQRMAKWERWKKPDNTK
ncbi:hypothetical protein DES53_12613 [Roseimicrobium gellanilyticum]|uniref:Uncharacterized protein n=1 Tax=Roseimicrobium gellanilyticum TaxID=748857 RepID=A0A366H0W4_9BACT|nr:hypothetical protein [Roseimicrobium gellanilyticum]RBP35137.1 hypothetical protein DES53_12613 [Roseimicrobium gellanilyticum]